MKTLVMKQLQLVFLFSLFLLHQGFAQDGSLDVTFGNNGTLSIDNTGGNAELLDLVATGNTFTAVGFTTVDNTEVATVIQYDQNGTINSAFGNNGQVIIPLGTGNGRASSATVQPDGKILIAGWARFSNKEQYFVARLQTNGTLDDTFGDSGITTGSFSNSSFAEDEVAAIDLLSDGKIVVAGRGYNGQNDDAFIGCFNTDGSLNTSFGTDGVVILDFANSPPSESATALVINDQDRIIVGGRVALSFNEEDSYFVSRLSSTGDLDNTFGTNGSLIYTLASNVIAGLNALALDNQGRIITGGGAFDTDELDNNFFLTRINTNGNVDESFGNNGELIIQRNSNETIWDLEALPSGDIIAAGSTGGFPSRFAVVRINEFGFQDLSFGNNGWATTQIESGFNTIRGIVVSNNRIYAAGRSFDNDTWKMTLAKYLNEGMASPTEEERIGIKNIELFPNPTSEILNVHLQLEAVENISAQLLDASGKLVQPLPALDQLAGEHILQIPVQALPPGTYYLTLRAGKALVAYSFQKL
jgi:uncharacterized delta-60 repeat protein